VGFPGRLTRDAHSRELTDQRYFRAEITF
jgi:hypothetical protein